MKIEGITFPTPGAVKWDGNKDLGIWGSPEHPVVMHVVVAGEVRAATKAERMAVRRHPEFGWVSTLEVELCAAGHGPHPMDDYHSPPGQRPGLSDIPEAYLAPSTSTKPSFRDWLTFAATGFPKAWRADNPLLKRVIYDLRAAMILDELEQQSWKDLSVSGAWDRATGILRSCGLVLPREQFDNVWWVYCNPPPGTEWAHPDIPIGDNDRLWAYHHLLTKARGAVHDGLKRASYLRYGTDPTPP